MPHWKTIAPPLLAGILAVALYAPSLSYPLLAYDDPILLGNVPLVHERTWQNLEEVLRRPIAGSHHPLHQISYAIDAALLGDRPFAFHLGNVLLYGVVAALVVAVARSLGRGDVAALAAGLVFAAHPVHVENVAWVSARKDLLSGALALGAFALYARGDGPPSRRALLGSLGLLALALLAKSTGSAVVLVLAFRAFVERRFDRREALRLLPFAALSAVALLVHARTQAAVGAAVGPHGGSWPQHARIVLRGLARYIETALVPAGLTPRPPFPALGSFPEAGDALALLVVALAVGAFVVSFQKCKRAPVPIALFFIALAPTANLIPIPLFVHERYLFLPSVGVAILAGDALEPLARARRSLALATGALLLASLATETLVYERAWRSDVELWSWALERNPDDLEALEREGTAELALGPPRAAHGERLLREALERAPNRLDANVRLGLLALERGELETARRHMLAASEGKASYVFQALVLQGDIDLARDDVAEAQASFERAAALAPGAVETLAGLGRMELVHGRAEAALSRYDAAIAAESAFGGAHLGRARALRALGRLDDASAELRRARERGAPGEDAAALAAQIALDRGDREGARAVLSGARPAAAVLVARARLAAIEGDMVHARSLVDEAVTRAGPGARREAASERELASLLK